jgi:hypothetical protein
MEITRLPYGNEIMPCWMVTNSKQCEGTVLTVCTRVHVAEMDEVREGAILR